MQAVSPSIFFRGSDVGFHQPWVMGILNVTPDSFFDGGKHDSLQAAVDHADQMLAAGADVLDLGAQSTRPGAVQVGPDEEWARLSPVLRAIRDRHADAVLSIDTFHPEVAQRALDAGADWINDVTGGTDAMWKVVAQARCPYVMMHMQGTPATMQDNPSYDDVTADVASALGRKLERAAEVGVTNVIVDVGFGFGKTVEHNFALLQNLESFQSLNRPVLVGVSRKSMIQRVLNVTSDQALNGTTALHAWALDRGAHILRVHDVKEACEVRDLHHALNRTLNHTSTN